MKRVLMSLAVAGFAALCHADLYNQINQSVNDGFASEDGGAGLFGGNYGAVCGQVVHDGDGSTQITKVAARFQSYYGLVGVKTAYLEVYTFNGSPGTMIYGATVSCKNTVVVSSPPVNDIEADNLKIQIVPGQDYLVVMQVLAPNDWSFIAVNSSSSDDVWIGDQDNPGLGSNGIWGFKAFQSSNSIGYGSNDASYDVVGNPQVTVSGTIYFNEFSGGLPKSVKMDFEDPSTNQVLFTEVATVQSGGTFLCSAPPAGNYLPSLETGTWLRRDGAEINTSSSVSGVTLSLDNGDCNGDNSVDGLDYSIWNYAYGSEDGDPNWIPGADLDGDGVVTGLDYSIWNEHYGELGDN